MVSNNSLNNLKPFTGATDPRRQNGRKKGQLNRKTVIRNLLSQKVDPNLLLGEPIPDNLANLKDKTYFEAIIYTLANQAIRNDTKASNLLLRELRHLEQSEPIEDPFQRDIQIQIVNSKDEIKRLEHLREDLEDQFGEDYEHLT